MTGENVSPVGSEHAGEKSKSQDLADRITTAALQGDFQQANSLREELISTDSMNLKLIVSTGEIIEQQKTKLLDKDHLAVWQTLYEECTDEETNGLFYSMQPTQLESNKLLQVQGKMSNRLFFIDSGKVVLFYRKDDKNKVAVQLGRGDIVGEETFFEISLCSLSAATQSDVKLYSLTRDAVALWSDTYPGLYEKLGDYCRREGKGREAVKQKDLERRSAPRYLVDGKASAVILDKDGQPSDTYIKGGLTDISQSGLCFDIKCSKQETARALLAQNIGLSLHFDDADEEPLKLQGQITKVSFHLHNDYCVHVKLGRNIDDETFKTLPCRRPVGSEDQ